MERNNVTANNAYALEEIEIQHKKVNKGKDRHCNKLVLCKKNVIITKKELRNWKVKTTYFNKLSKKLHTIV